MTNSAAAGSATAGAPPRAFDALRHRQFAFFWVSAVISNSATWMQQVALFAVIYDLSGRQGKWLGIVGLASAIPSVLLTPIAGVLADRVSRRMVLIVTQLAQAAAAFVLWAMHVEGALTPWRIVAITFASGVASGFTVASWQSFVPTLVPRENLIEAVRLNSLQFTLSRALGPTLGALLVALWGTGSAFMANAVTYLLLVAAIAAARPVQSILRRSTDSFRAVLVEGARYAFHDPLIRQIVIFTSLISALGQSLMTVAAAAADQLYGRPAEDNSWLVAAVGAGAALASIAVLAVAHRAPRSQIVNVGVVIYVAGLGLVPATSLFGVGVLAYGLTGAAHMLVATSLNTLVQAKVPDHIRGRVLSFYLLGIMLGFPAGAYLLGLAGDAFGLRRVLVVNAALFVVVSVLSLRSPAFRDLDDDIELAT